METLEDFLALVANKDEYLKFRMEWSYYHGVYMTLIFTGKYDPTTFRDCKVNAWGVDIKECLQDLINKVSSMNLATVTEGVYKGRTVWVDTKLRLGYLCELYEHQFAVIEPEHLQFWKEVKWVNTATGEYEEA